MTHKNAKIPPKGEIIIYQSKDQEVKIEVKLERETVWLTQKQIAGVFNIDRSVITKHLRNIFESNELDQNSVRAKIAHTAADGNKRIAASIFLWFLEKNGLLYKKDSSKRIADNALVAFTLMIAESNPTDRQIIIMLVVNLINKSN